MGIMAAGKFDDLKVSIKLTFNTSQEENSSHLYDARIVFRSAHQSHFYQRYQSYIIREPLFIKFLNDFISSIVDADLISAFIVFD